MDTIFALATAQGKAGVAIVRLSGPASRSAAAGLSGQKLPDRGLTVATLSSEDGSVLDHAVILTFAAPASFTGEDVVELHLHGSTAVVSAVLGDLSEKDALRLAEPGEFTRRALENGKLDLAQVEGLADLIDAETEVQRRQAQATLSGQLGCLAKSWRTKLIRAAALIEAAIDFADEDVPTDVTPEVLDLLHEVGSELRTQVDGVVVAERIRSGFEVAIVGAPNAGKSTLLNALAGRDAAITSAHAGTTRDVIEVRMDLAGIPVTLLDTAGLRDAEDEVESLGIELARSRARQADLRVFLAGEAEVLDVVEREDDIRVHPKADLYDGSAFSVSGVTGAGLDQLISMIVDRLKGRVTSAGLTTRERHRIAMLKASAFLSRAEESLSFGPDQYDVSAEEMRSAVRALESLVGFVDVENLLDEIFASFCLGK